MDADKKPPIDNPITTSAEDTLGRAVVAHDFARSLRQLDATQGMVVGVLGAWGRGKSSFVNLMKEEFTSGDALPVIEFNPWLFSGSQQLTDVFFREISAELRIKDDGKFESIANGLEKYGDILSPVALIPWVGGWWDRAFKATKQATTFWADRKGGSGPLRQKVSRALLELDHPIVVVIDDIDRLTTPEIRDIFKLVRLTAGFPNIIYLLAFDRRRVEGALAEGEELGRDYLEKIVQLSFDLPAIPRELLRARIFERLDMVLNGSTSLRFNQEEWQDVYFEIIEPLIHNLRDVTRLALSASPTIQALGSEIETVDLIALESVRVFRPELFEELQKLRITLTETSSVYGSRDMTRQQGEIAKLISLGGDDKAAIQQLIQRVFPAARQYTENFYFGQDQANVWKREHRVANLLFLDLYFGRTAPSDLRVFSQAEKAFSYLRDSDSLGQYLDSIPPDEVEGTITGLEAYQDEFSPDEVVPASIALMNRIHKIPERKRGMFDFMRPDIVVGRVVLRLLRQIDDEVALERMAREILSKLNSYSSQLSLITAVGHEEGAGHRLLSEQTVAVIETELAECVLRSPTSVPNEEWDLLRVYWLFTEGGGSGV